MDLLTSGTESTHSRGGNITPTIRCSACGTILRPGTLFCSRCGIYLPPDGPLPTEPLPEEELPASQIGPEALVGKYGDAELLETAMALSVLIIRSNRQALFLLPIDEISLGRRDATYKVFPDLDLTPDGGLEEGVSRKHAKIYQRDNHFLVEDVGSANGTFLNDQRITPYLPYLLRGGDMLQLGRLRMVVEFG
ncbi:MAG: FHA domain-containing protein [Chloroflexi bacterium]|nr:FHA domain-containing protein [Chloroflexota bacterium]